MRTLALGWLLWCGAFGQEAVFEPPKVGQIDFYGLKRLTPERIQREAKLAPGMPLPASQPLLVERLIAIKEVAQASVEAVCCEDQRVVLYVGIQERGAPGFDIREPSPDEGVPVLSADILTAYRALLEAMNDAARRGETAEDISRGHSLLRDETSRGWQLRLEQLAEPNVDALRRALRAGSDDERAAAAYTLGYVAKKAAVVNDLQYALRDPDPTVRANALRALVPVMKLGLANKSAGIRVEYTWIVEMLHSVFFQDRQNAIQALLTLSDGGLAGPRELIRERALDPLAEMARWRQLAQALPAFLLLGRAAGIPDAELEKQWVDGNRETVITKALRENSVSQRK
jgi:hypothetical protein